ncbi:MAG: sulfite exporter TauE/SafE family protein [Gammaproteobacteria bacterium]
MDLMWWHYVLLMLSGVAAGFMNVMAGGGSMLTVPVMVFLGLPGPVANGSNRIAIVAQSITAVTTFFSKGFSDFRLSVTLALCAVPGAVLGAMAGVRLQGEWFNRVLAVVLLFVMVMLWRKGSTKQQSDAQPVSKRRLLAAHALMVGVGFYGGFIQIGVGFLLIGVLANVLNLDLVRVNMHKVFIAGSFNLAALIVYAVNVPLVWALGLTLAVGNSVGGWLGAQTSVNKGESAIKWVLNAVLVVFIIKLLFFT